MDEKSPMRRSVTDFRDPAPLDGGTACYSLTGNYADIGLTSLRQSRELRLADRA
jgi:hypothetical protein